MRNSNYLNFYVWDKHLVINTHHKTYFHLLLKRYYCVELNGFLYAAPTASEASEQLGRGRWLPARFQSAVPGTSA